MKPGEMKNGNKKRVATAVNHHDNIFPCRLFGVRPFLSGAGGMGYRKANNNGSLWNLVFDRSGNSNIQIGEAQLTRKKREEDIVFLSLEV
jgi:hypothetical protein